MNGRPSVVTEIALQKLEEVFALGGSDKEACLYADISPSTLYNYQQENPDFLERKGLLKDKPILLARQAVIGGFTTNPHLALKFLERRKRDEFDLKHEDPEGPRAMPIINIISYKDCEDLGDDEKSGVLIDETVANKYEIGVS